MANKKGIIIPNLGEHPNILFAFREGVTAPSRYQYFIAQPS